MIKLEDKLYTSTEVADILGVSLRSVYRYIEENKLHAEVKTATGRHRFTRQDILNFLYPEGVKEDEDPTETDTTPKKSVSQGSAEQSPAAMETPSSQPVEPQMAPQPTHEPPAQQASTEGEDNVDWLSKFREAAKKFQEEETTSDQTSAEAQPVESQVAQDVTPAEGITGLGATPEAFVVEEAPVQDTQEGSMHYYKSGLGGLKEIAQNIDKSARNSQLPYAFTLNAGLSLHSPIKPFSLLHAYVRVSDLEFFEKSLQLSETDTDSAQLCVVTSDDASVYSDSEELHGLFVVGKARLVADIARFGDASLQEESAGLLD